MKAGDDTAAEARLKIGDVAKSPAPRRGPSVTTRRSASSPAAPASRAPTAPTPKRTSIG